MTDRCIHCWKPLIVATLLLWCMESVPGAASHSDGMEQKFLELGTQAPRGSAAAQDGCPAATQDPPLTRLAYSADELKDRIRRAPIAPDSRSGEKQEPPRTLRAIKGRTGDYVTASCADLRMTLVQLLRKVNALKKREHSLFSGLSETEKQELDEANQKLTEVSTVLNARCSALSSE
ncbi:MAG: hypothetical protein ACLP5H_20295 [Desulfomonilaceae bacterium]